MSCHETAWPSACPRHQDSDGRPLIPCEVRVHIHDARCVTITGTMLCDAEPLVLTQQPGHDWIARLLLTPGHYTARLHVIRATLTMPWHSNVTHSWDITFHVPELKSDARHTAELRVWLHDPATSNSRGRHHHDQ